MERKRLKGVFSVYQKCGHIGLDHEEVPITTNREQPLLPPDVLTAIKEKEQRERNGEVIKKDPPEHKKQAPMLPPSFYVPKSVNP